MIEKSQISSSLLSEIFSFTALLVISGLVLIIIRYYLPLRTTPIYLLIPIFFALALPASIVLLVPIDLASIVRSPDAQDSQAIWLPTRVILVAWRIIYWETFFLTWFILPILAEYADAGFRDPKARLFWSLKRNLIYHAAVFGSGIVAMLYFFTRSGISFTTLKGLLVATAYFWSLLFAIFLMGHGLVSIPRRLFQSANLHSTLNNLYSQAVILHEKKTDAIDNLENLEAQVLALAEQKTESAIRFQDWIEELAEDPHFPLKNTQYHTRRRSFPEIIIPRIITEQYLANLSRALCRARHVKAQYDDEWEQVVKTALEIRDTLEAYPLGRIEIGNPSPGASIWERFVPLTPRTRFLYRYYFLPNLKRLLGIFLSIASFLILWSEVIKPINPFFSIIAITVYHPNREHGDIGLVGQIIASLWILYMCSAALITITEIKAWRGRALVRRNTHGESAMWYSYQVVKLSVPLSFNFITFLDADIYKRTVFYEFLGNLINMTPLSSKVDLLWSTFIIIPAFATFFSLYGRIQKFIGYDGVIIDEEDNIDSDCGGSSSWNEGKILVDQELQSPSINIGQSSTRLHNTRHRKTNNSTVMPFAPTAIERQVTAGPSSLLRSNADRQRRTDQSFDENSYGSFWHRLRNTADTIQPQRWFQSIGNSVITPKWILGKNYESQSNNVENSNWSTTSHREGRLRI